MHFFRTTFTSDETLPQDTSPELIETTNLLISCIKKNSRVNIHGPFKSGRKTCLKYAARICDWYLVKSVEKFIIYDKTSFNKICTVSITEKPEFYKNLTAYVKCKRNVEDRQIQFRLGLKQWKHYTFVEKYSSFAGNVNFFSNIMSKTGDSVETSDSVKTSNSVKNTRVQPHTPIICMLRWMDWYSKFLINFGFRITDQRKTAKFEWLPMIFASSLYWSMYPYVSVDQINQILERISPTSAGKFEAKVLLEDATVRSKMLVWLRNFDILRFLE